jgi:hypothetical protein
LQRKVLIHTLTWAGVEFGQGGEAVACGKRGLDCVGMKAASGRRRVFDLLSQFRDFDSEFDVLKRFDLLLWID